MFSIFNEKQGEDIDFESGYIVVNQLGIRGYEMSHIDKCKEIWKELVPKKGQAEYVQGELLRQIEKLRYEAVNNGNINWDDSFEWFCEYIKSTLLESKAFEKEHMKKIGTAMDYIKECGKYAYKYNNGVISDEDANPMLFAYTDDDLYDYIADAIAIYAEYNVELIVYDKKDYIYR